MKKLTTEEFIEKAIKVHGDKYDYSLVDYSNNKKKIMIVCKRHGVFEQQPNGHLQGSGCPKCSGNTRLKTCEWIEKAKEVHGDRYDYSLVKYVSQNEKVKIICKEHGVFEQSSGNHMTKSGCPKCSGHHQYTENEWIRKAISIHGNKYNYSLAKYKSSKEKVKIICKEHGVFEQVASDHLSDSGCRKCGLRTPSTNEWINRSKGVHGDKYDYSLAKYTNAKEKIKIICKKHGIFEQTPNNHTGCCGCPRCSGQDKPTTDEWIKEAVAIHRNTYDYSFSKYIDSQTRIKIICKKHGEFYQLPYVHLRGSGCKKCKHSKGEERVLKDLTKRGIKFQIEKTFQDCRDIGLLKFDFYLPDYNICIEYDGEQHYRPVQYGGMSYEKAILKYCMTKNRDRLKTEYCKREGIKLIRIPYTEFNNIELILRRGG